MLGKEEFQEVSEVAIFNEIGNYAENQGYDVVYFKSLFPKMNKDNLGLSSLTMNDLEYKYVHYVHIYGDEGLKVSIYFDVDSLVCLFQEFPYYELYDLNDVKRGDVFVRKYDEFMSIVDREKYPNIKQKFRFEIIY